MSDHCETTTEAPSPPSPSSPTAPGARNPIDPWEPFNRHVHHFNNGVDRYIAKPLARGYIAITPPPVRLSNCCAASSACNSSEFSHSPGSSKRSPSLGS